MHCFRKAISCLLTLALLVSMMPMTILGADAAGLPVSERAVSRILTPRWVPNPLYPDFPQPEAPAHSHAARPAAQGTYMDSQQAVAYIRQQMVLRNETISVSLRLTDSAMMSDLSGAFEDLIDQAVAHTGVPEEGDYINFHFGGYYLEGSFTPDNDALLCDVVFHMSYYTDLAQEQMVDAEVDRLVAELGLMSMSDYDKIRTVYDYIVQTLTYDEGNVNNPGYKTQFTAYGALIDKVAVCQGYANLLYRLLLEVGVDCRLIQSIPSECHAWNIVRLQGRYYNCDATWDNTLGNTPDTYVYFLKGDDFFRDHTPDRDYHGAEFFQKYPTSSSDYDPAGGSDGTEEHFYFGTTVNPTCEEGGYTLYQCMICGDSYYGDLTEPTGHNYQSLVHEGTCTERGYTSYLCLFCFDYYEEPHTAPTGHSWGDWTVIAEPTDTAPGTRERVCQVCGTKETVSFLNGDSIQFKPEEAVTRGNICYYLWLQAGQPLPQSQEHPYEDLDPADYWYNACLWAVEANITSGISTTKFSPEDSVTRGQGVTFLWRALGCPEPTLQESPYVDVQEMDYFARPVYWAAENGHSMTLDLCQNKFWPQENLLFCHLTGEGDLGNHPYEVREHKPTCTEPGYTEFACTACGLVYTTSQTEPLGHDYEATKVIQPDCTTDGCTEYTCRNCGHQYTDDIIPATGHDIQVYQVVEPTCEAGGFSKLRCVNCGGQEATGHPTEALGHDYEAVIVPADCTKGGYTQYTCKRCDHSYTGDHTEPIAHDYRSTVTEPTCTEQGFTTNICAVCGYSCTSDEVPALGHSYESTFTGAECVGGKMTYRCSRCSHRYTEEVPGTGVHDLIEWTTIVPAGCLEPGSEERWCRNCTYSEERAIPAAGHDYEVTVIPPTCYEDGYTDHSCHKCGDWYDTDPVPALEHDWDEGVITLEPTTEQEGQRVHTCNYCGAEWTEYLDRLPEVHQHQMSVWYVILEPTCTTEGEERSECQHCGYYESKAIPVLKHSYTSVVTEPTCTDNGFVTYTCKCGEQYTEFLEHHLGHDWDAGVVITEPTPETEGLLLRTCTRCQDTLEEVIPTIPDENATKIYEEEPNGLPVLADQICHNCFIYGRMDLLDLADYYSFTLDYEADVSISVVADWETLNYYILDADTEEWMAGYIFDGYDEADAARSSLRTTLPAGDYYLVFEDYDYIQDYEAYVRFDPTDGTHIHSHAAEITEPTCEAGGYTTYTCTCGDSYIADETDALGHDFGEWIESKKPGCLTEGEEVRDCSRCDEYEMQPIPATGHSHTPVITEPTCTEQGYTTHYCPCGDSYVDSYTEATGHQMGDWQESKKPGCLTEGEEVRGCDLCDHVETQPIPATGHSFGQWVVTKEATEDTEGEELRACSGCGISETRAIPKLDHVHKHTSEVTAPTCTEPGFTTYTCECGDSYTADETAALGHDFGQWVVTKVATEDTEGEEKRACSGCGISETRTIPKLDHVHKHTAEVTAPTCTEPGFTTYTCACGDTYTSDETAALGHEFVDGTCTRCEADDPDYVEPVVNPFTDVPAGQWYTDPVLWAVEKGITSGTSANTFSPDKTCTRGQVVTFLWRAKGEPEPTLTENPFSDVKEGDYFYKAVLWAVENGITSGTSKTTFAPNNPCTRAQVVTFLWRTMEKPAPDKSGIPFTDVPAGQWYTDPILWAVENGITSGTGKTTFAPNNPCTRAQVVTFLYRAFKEN